MANYYSKYTGEQIDAAIEKAQISLTVLENENDSGKILIPTIAIDNTQKNLEIGEGLEIKESSILQVEENLKTDVVFMKERQNNIANALKGNASGEVISLDDVSSLEHTLEVKARSKNIIPFPYDNESGYENNGITYTYGADGIIYASGTNTAVSRNYLVSTENPRPSISAGTYTLSAIADVEGNLSGSSAVLYVVDDFNNAATIHYIDLPFNGKPRVFTIDKDYTFYIYLYLASGANPDNVAIRVQIEKGTTATEYTPYADVEQTKVLATGKNLFNDLAFYAANGYEKQENGSWYNPTSVNVNLGLPVIGYKGQYTFSIDAINLSEKEETSTYESIPLWIQFDYTDGTRNYIQVKSKEWVHYSITSDEDKIVKTILWSYGSSTPHAVKNAMLVVDSIEAKYEPYTETEYPVNADGTAQGVQSIAPNMTIMSDTANVVLDAQYNKDSNIVIEKLVQAIISLGGNV